MKNAPDPKMVRVFITYLGESLAKKGLVDGRLHIGGLLIA
jgi:hypothetical protein